MAKKLFIVYLLIATILDKTIAQSGTSCTTPNGERARCVSVYKCPVFLRNLHDRTPSVLNFLRQSQCGYERDPLVCCGSVAHWTERNTQPPVPFNRPNVRVTQQSTNRLLPNRQVCGVNGVGNRILNGEVTALDEFPWMALLEYRSRTGRTSHSCGGMLVSSRYVLTAAHCVTGGITRQVGNLFRVRLGEYDTNTSEDCLVDSGFEDCADPHQDISVEEAIPHPEYTDSVPSRYHDIALLRLARPVQFTDFIKPICLPTQGERSRAGDGLFVAGWGLTERKVFSPVKLKLKIPIVANENCGRIFSRAGIQVRNSQLCAGGEAGKDSCQGDSGGPLMRPFPNSPDVWYAEGIVSFGAECGTRGVPGVYTRIADYVDWITQTIRP